MLGSGYRRKRANTIGRARQAPVTSIARHYERPSPLASLVARGSQPKRSIRNEHRCEFAVMSIRGGYEPTPAPLPRHSRATSARAWRPPLTGQ